MKKRKRMSALLLALALTVSLIACGQTATEETPPEEQANEEAPPKRRLRNFHLREGLYLHPQRTVP